MTSKIKHVGLAVDIEIDSPWWCTGNGRYLLGIYQSHNEMCDISEYQKKRFYTDEVKHAPDS